jgi:uncharacterized protein YcbK (DUF882 family)
MSRLSPHFQRSEFECPCGLCNTDPVVDHTLIEVLEDVRTHFDKSITVTSGTRCIYHNISVGGSEESQHLTGRAADIIVRSRAPHEIVEYLDNKYPNTLGIGSYATFTHVDSRTKRARW